MILDFTRFTIDESVIQKIIFDKTFIEITAHQKKDG